MTNKQRIIVKICFIILAISMVIMAISTVIQVIHDGWSSINIVTFVPFIGGAVVFIGILSSNKKKDDKK